MRNRESLWIPVKHGNLCGVINPDLMTLLEAGFFEDVGHQVTDRGGRVVKDSRLRWAATVPLESGKTLFIKQFRLVERWQRYKYAILPSRVRTEWRISRFLSQRGISTPRALGVLERREYGLTTESFFIAEALEGAKDLVTSLRDRLHGADGVLAREQILRLLAETIRKIHDAGLFHRDLHGGNFLVVQESSPGPYLVDLHQARKQFRVSRSKRLWNIAQIFNSFDSMLDGEAKRQFLLTYGHGYAPFVDTLDSSLKRVDGMVRKMVKRHQKSRAKRCLKESTLFTIDRRGGLTIFRRREIGGDEVMEILAAHRVPYAATATIAYPRDHLLGHLRPPSACGRVWPLAARADQVRNLLSNLPGVGSRFGSTSRDLPC